MNESFSDKPMSGLGKINNSISGRLKVFTCNSNKELAKSIAERMGVSLSRSTVGRFADGEISISIEETVRLCDVFIIQSTAPPVNEHLMELLIMVDALKRASAFNINVVLPYFGYARQDRKSKARDPISAKLVANLLTTAGADRIVTMDLHSPQVQGFFDIPFDHLMGLPLFVEYFKEKKERGLIDSFDEYVVVSPDLGAVNISRALSNHLQTPLAIVDKRRPRPNQSEVKNLIGEVQNKHCIIIDDAIDTGGSLVNAAEALIEKGALSVCACVTHGIFSNNAVDKLNNSCLREVIVTDTISHNSLPDKFTVLSVDRIFANALLRIHNGYSVSELFN